jgi:hypothetical protein
MASVSIDIDLDEFDTDDLIDELSTTTLSKSDKEELSEILYGLDKQAEIKTMKDEMKMEFFLENFAKISLENLESIIK